MGGKDASVGSYPWQVALVSSSGQTFCGGTLINNKNILTAGHCMIGQDESSFHAVLGETDLTSISPESRYRISKISVHPQFSGPPNYFNDLSLLELDRMVEFSQKVSPACLPKAGPRIYGVLMISGWGLMQDEAKRQPKRLKEGVVIQKAQSYCSKMYGSKFTSKHICANSRTQDVCNGDSGGPLMLKSRGKIFVVGVVSFGYVCGYYPYPAVFTRTAEYLEWIFQTTSGNEYCSK